MDERARIVITKNGPLLVYGGVPVSVQVIGGTAAGASSEYEAGPEIVVGERYALCRCGSSSQKPFCDGTHKKVGFDGTETASSEPYEALSEEFAGPTHVLGDVPSLCSFARFCDNGEGIWNDVHRTDDAAVRELVVHEAQHCPAGRLVVRERASGKVLEPALPASIVLLEDPAQECSGPLWVRGGVPIESADGTSYEVRNRVTLCRCGASQNKPFCDGQHADVKFTDGIL
jgi:CDGSH-type Zn-finger protein